MKTKSQLRTELLAARRAVPEGARVTAARAVARHIAATRWLSPGKRIGLYASMPQELGTQPLIELALARGCEVYLPKITSMRGRRMAFVPISDRVRLHRFGMHEPTGTGFFPARGLDTVFVPGVGFDPHGGRIGHGAGFYDRAFAFRQLRGHWRGPRLVGVAYSCQVVPFVPVTATDIRMDYIVTDRGIDESLVDEDGAVDVRHR